MLLFLFLTRGAEFVPFSLPTLFAVSSCPPPSPQFPFKLGDALKSFHTSTTLATNHTHIHIQPHTCTFPVHRSFHHHLVNLTSFVLFFLFQTNTVRWHSRSHNKPTKPPITTPLCHRAMINYWSQNPHHAFLLQLDSHPYSLTASKFKV